VALPGFGDNPHDRDRAAQVELILQRVDALPTLSPVATRLMRVSGAEDADLDEIVTLIESDPALSARILGLCRRADLGLGDQITTVRRAVIMLGLEAVQSAVLSVHVYDLLDREAEGLDPDGEGAEGVGRFDRTGIWRHAIGVACASELIASRHPSVRVRPEAAFVAGLLHDIGRLTLELVLPRAYQRVVALAERRACDSAPVERQVIGLDHHTAGRRIARRWGLPSAIQDVIWLHAQPIHSLPDTPERELVGVVTLAKALCRRQHLGWSGDFGEPADVESLASHLGLPPQAGAEILPDLLEALGARCAVLGLDERTPPELMLESIARANERLSALNQALLRRGRRSDHQKRVLDAIGAFHADWSSDMSVSETLGRVAASAESVFGPGFYASVHQPGAGRPWLITQFGAGGRVMRAHSAEAPPGISGGGALATLADTSQLTMGAVGALPWLSDYLSDAADLRNVRLLALCSAGTHPGRSGAPREEADAITAVLLHEPDPQSAGFTREELGAITSAWSAAVMGAARHERARRLGETLAESSRELAEMQAAMTERESMTRLGEMSAGAAHEMNNPLTIIRGRSQMLAQRLQGAADRATAQAIVEASEHLGELIESMHLLACPPEPCTEALEPASLVREGVERARRRCGSGRGARVICDEGVGLAQGDREQVLAALTELIVNAMEAAPNEIVELRVQTDPLDDRLVFRIVDHGRGLSRRASRHAFDPFFSEKGAGRQTGLGLARAKRLIELQGGEISLSNGPEGGCVATIAIPRSAPAPGGGFVGRLAA
jgi:putative nucleotidyltransferase with HDIG domain